MQCPTSKNEATKECTICPKIQQEWHLDQLLEDIAEGKFVLKILNMGYDEWGDNWEKLAKYIWQQEYSENSNLSRNNQDDDEIYEKKRQKNITKNQKRHGDKYNKGLTPREECIICLFLDGMNTEQITKHLEISYKKELSNGLNRWVKFITTRKFSDAALIKYHLAHLQEGLRDLRKYMKSDDFLKDLEGFEQEEITYIEKAILTNIKHGMKTGYQREILGITNQGKPSYKKDPLSILKEELDVELRLSISLEELLNKGKSLEDIKRILRELGIDSHVEVIEEEEKIQDTHPIEEESNE